MTRGFHVVAKAHLADNRATIIVTMAPNQMFPLLQRTVNLPSLFKQGEFCCFLFLTCFIISSCI